MKLIYRILFPLMFVAMLMLFHGILAGQAEKRLPITTQIKFAQGISREEYFEIKQLGNLKLTAFSEIDARVRVMDGMREALVMLVVAEEEFSHITSLPIIRGAFFFGSTDNLAIICESLALELFMSLEILGAAIEINGFDYTVCGIYENEKTLAGMLSDDSHKRVYVPLASEAGEVAVARDMFLSSFKGAPILADQLALLMAHNIPVESVISHPDTLNMINQNGRLQIFFITMSGAFFLFILGLRRAYAIWGRKLNKRDIILCLGLVVSAALLFRLSMFTPVFPQTFLTSEGRVETSHLLRIFIDNAQAINSSGADFWARYGHRVLLWSSVLCAGTFLVLVVAVVMHLKAK